MKKLLLHGGSSHRGVSASIACVLGALVAGCATGSPIENEDVVFIARTPPSSGEPGDRGGEGLEAPVDEGAGADPLQPVSGEASEGLDDDLPRGEQPGEEQPGEDDSAPEDSEPVPPVDVPIVDTEEPDVDDPDPTPGPGSNPIIQPDPVPDAPVDADDGPPVSDPVLPPVTQPEPVPPLAPDDALPAAGHCLAGWEGSSCDTCSGQTQSDRLACRLYIDCYIVSDCDPATCGSVEQACGVNRVGNGLAPKEIADSVYACMCAP